MSEFNRESQLYLPVVSQEVGEAMQRSVAEEGIDSFIDSTESKFRREQPYLHIIVQGILALHERDDDERQLVESTVGLVYDLLSRQAEVDAMNAEHA